MERDVFERGGMLEGFRLASWCGDAARVEKGGAVGLWSRISGHVCISIGEANSVLCAWGLEMRRPEEAYGGGLMNSASSAVFQRSTQGTSAALMLLREKAFNVLGVWGGCAWVVGLGGWHADAAVRAPAGSSD